MNFKSENNTEKDRNCLFEIDEDSKYIANYGVTNNPKNHYNYTINEFRGEEHKKILNLIFSNRDIHVIYDIGANSGATCDLFIYYSNKHKNNLKKLYLFEPEIVNFKFIENNIKKHPKNLIKIYNKGIFYGKKNAQVYLPLCNNDIYYTCGGFSICPETRTDNIRMSKIDKVFELVELEELELLKPDFIKMDIEGAEKNLLKNSSLIKQAKYIFLEWKDGELISDIVNKYLKDFEIIFTYPDILLQKKNMF